MPSSVSGQNAAIILKNSGQYNWIAYDNFIILQTVECHLILQKSMVTFKVQ